MLSLKIISWIRRIIKQIVTWFQVEAPPLALISNSLSTIISTTTLTITSIQVTLQWWGNLLYILRWTICKVEYLEVSLNLIYSVEQINQILEVPKIWLMASMECSNKIHLASTIVKYHLLKILEACLWLQISTLTFSKTHLGATCSTNFSQVWIKCHHTIIIKILIHSILSWEVKSLTRENLQTQSKAIWYKSSQKWNN